MANIRGTSHFFGGHNLTEGHGPETEHLGAIVVDGTLDMGDMLTALQALADKLDADAGVTDTDYRATLDATIAALRNSVI